MKLLHMCPGYIRKKNLFHTTPVDRQMSMLHIWAYGGFGPRDIEKLTLSIHDEPWGALGTVVHSYTGPGFSL